ncbi:MAG: YqaE/Pmp3 family membrane protein [Bacteroidota bacterium]
MKNVLWVALVGVAVSCTVSKRIDRWGYRVSFDKKSQETETIANESTSTNETTIAIADNSNNQQVVSTHETRLAAAVQTPEVQTTMVTNETLAKVARHEQKAVEAKIKPSAKELRAAKTIAKQMNSFEAKVAGGLTPSQGVLVLLAILIPILAVYLYEGSWTKRCTVNLILCLLCGIPGMIHALIVVLE